ncbi:DUF4942 domain-containing protein [Acidovorax sp. sic0104]|uniref:DUF4942 domain-containing protein n=1 Tax=Acidovorax sp. sic0104 TaxID=2854784 RepID=UPI001C4812F9|nr:DUF4942 domain-containing protein [Acidovorax sp. sic0104]MBV7542170.1 DUF4942 domain-containing protein [Acidovorax sp. sic0104]
MDTLQFYPTGERTAALMWSKFKRSVRHVCDPSAGRGHLLHYAEEGFPNLTDDEIPWIAELDEGDASGSRFREYARTKYSGISERSVVEIDVAHHPHLKEMGVSILGYDFLDIRSLATVTTLILNPPFQAGCAHVLHGWDCLVDGELVAIINAETIRNPYSQDRRRLSDLIQRHGSVEFLKDQFVRDVERVTEVEVALIHLDKTPQKYLEIEKLLGDLARCPEGPGEVDPDVCNALALPNNFAGDACFRFEQAVAAARRASESMAVADHLARGLGLTLEEMQAKGLGGDFREMALPIREVATEDFCKRYKELKKRAWASVLRSSLLSDKLSNLARKKLEASAAHIYDLAFTEANIHGLFRGVVEAMPNIFEEMMVQLFDTIIGRNNDNVVFYKSFKSNDKHRIGMRLRKTRFILPRMKTSFKTLDYEAQAILGDIDKCFHYLHGGTGEYDGIVASLNKGLATGASVDTRYFRYRWFAGAQTIHVSARNPEVMERLNRFVGRLRQWLPGDMAEANDDFRKQYETAEALKDEYEKSLSAQRATTGTRLTSLMSSEITYSALRQAQGREEDGDSIKLQRLAQAMEVVHESHGLQCGAALPTAAPLAALEMGGNPPPVQASGGEPEQLLLLAA